MAYISVHHTKEERERDDCVDGRIDLFIGRHGILIHNHLEVLCKLVRLK